MFMEKNHGRIVFWGSNYSCSKSLTLQPPVQKNQKRLPAGCFTSVRNTIRRLVVLRKGAWSW